MSDSRSKVTALVTGADLHRAGRALVIYALVAGGAWFGPISWSRSVTLATLRATG